MTSIGAASNSAQNSKVIGKQKNANLVQTKGEFAETLKTNVATNKKDTANGELPAQRVLFIVQLHDLLKAVELSEEISFYKWEMPEDQYQEEMQFQQRSLETRMRGLEAKYILRPDIPDRSNYLGDKPYAQVFRGEQVVAKISNEGVVEIKWPLPKAVRESLLGSLNGINGPDFAQARAEQLAKVFGGKIVKPDTDLTPSGYSKI